MAQLWTQKMGQDEYDKERAYIDKDDRGGKDHIRSSKEAVHRAAVPEPVSEKDRGISGDFII